MSKKERLTGFISGILVCSILSCGYTFAKNILDIAVEYNNIKVYLDGEVIDTKDANGKYVEPFIYEGSTFLPIRAIGEAFGKEVSWNGDKYEIYIGTKPGNSMNWLEECGPYEYKDGEEYRYKNNQFFKMSGETYTDGFVLGTERYANPAEAMFNLNGKYNSVTFKVGHVDGTEQVDITLNIYLDGLLKYTDEVRYDDVAKNITINLNKAQQMKIEILEAEYASEAGYGFAKGVFE